jgi:hypothetical protein
MQKIQRVITNKEINTHLIEMQFNLPVDTHSRDY